MVSSAPGKIITTVINNSDSAWNGVITANVPGAVTEFGVYRDTTAGCARPGNA